ncbi:hypothetical protein GOODEAATRI_028736 [Goodea atripinnis]|uniref:Uncharacterized protein n=1 Tax=Goodea atripinnis TaxID=208336 RepID=A0ABV0NFX4_9TELE
MPDTHTCPQAISTSSAHERTEPQTHRDAHSARALHSHQQAVTHARVQVNATVGGEVTLRLPRWMSAVLSVFFMMNRKQQPCRKYPVFPSASVHTIHIGKAV